MFCFDELAVYLNICGVTAFLILLSEMKEKRSFSLWEFLRKPNFRKRMSRFFKSYCCCGSKTNQLNFSIRMRSITQLRITSLHQLNFTCLFPNVLDSSHIAIYIKGDNVLIIIQRKSIFNIIDDLTPIDFQIKDIATNKLLNGFNLLPVKDYFNFIVVVYLNNCI